MYLLIFASTTDAQRVARLLGGAWECRKTYVAHPQPPSHDATLDVKLALLGAPVTRVRVALNALPPRERDAFEARVNAAVVSRRGTLIADSLSCLWRDAPQWPHHRRIPLQHF